jgi:hypothetical protein
VATVICSRGLYTPIYFRCLAASDACGKGGARQLSNRLGPYVGSTSATDAPRRSPIRISPLRLQLPHLPSALVRPLLGGELLPRYVLNGIGEGLKHGAAPSVGV